ncbi:hypothetical protein [Thiosulfativibrio zosterae]|uniref:Protein BatD n=1 Tax=Thiosulfativibrio zosterae TaxID=2675053 RepID=A0A6F8PJT0_9GAMM|nr:hypothetical protein [Thiosulfativibrio zosterae]BBP42361.1 hypothetical protein THMIRHAT_01070 [Thiosulfativibrio zosterae]
MVSSTKLKVIMGAFLGVCLVLMSTLAEAVVKVYPRTVQLGEPVTLVLTGEKIEQDFEQIDKSPIRQHFEIYEVEGNADRVRLTLYPLRVGDWTLPKMQAGQIDFAGVTIQVKENSAVEVKWQHPDSSLPIFAQQRYVWQGVVKTEPEFAVTLEAHPHQKPPIETFFTAQPVAIDRGLFGEERHFLMAFWSEQAGSFALRSPVIRVKNNSQKTWLFFDNTQTVKVKSLPNYLPLNMPVGQLAVQSDPLPWFLEASELNLWSLRVTGDNILADRLPNVPQKLQNSPALEWLSPTQKQYQAWSKLGWKTTQIWEMPFRAQHLGWVTLPPLRLTYFDVTTQQLQDVVLPATLKWVLPSGAFVFFKTLIGFLGLGLGLLLWLWVKAWFLKWQTYRMIEAATDNQQVWLAIRQLIIKIQNDSFGQIKPQFNELALSIEAGFNLWFNQNKTNVSHETLDVIEAFNRHFYGAEALPLHESQRLAQSWLSQQSATQMLLNELRTMRYFLKATPKA